ncbi:MAG: hypothetical protein LBC40_05375 [Dysgonamonadaceae bacterium]|jgi:acyl carrier protein|nr:hypothetical protein [Dysgonamonadaceae bacterium]
MSNSKQAIQFISLLEEEFDIEFPNEELMMDNLLSYNKLSINSQSGINVKKTVLTGDSI